MNVLENIIFCFEILLLCSHSASLVDGQLFIFGGWDAPECFNDLWTLDIGMFISFLVMILARYM